MLCKAAFAFFLCMIWDTAGSLPLTGKAQYGSVSARRRFICIKLPDPHSLCVISPSVTASPCHRPGCKMVAFRREASPLGLTSVRNSPFCYPHSAVQGTKWSSWSLPLPILPFVTRAPPPCIRHRRQSASHPCIRHRRRSAPCPRHRKV